MGRLETSAQDQPKPSADDQTPPDHESTTTPSPPSHHLHQVDSSTNPPTEPDDDVDSLPAVKFPPSPPKNMLAPPASTPENRLVPFLPIYPESKQSKGESSRENSHVGDSDIDIDSIPAVPFPPKPSVPATDTKLKQNGLEKVPVAKENGGDDVNAAAVVNKPASRQSSLIRKREPPVVLVESNGNPWSSDIFDCCDHPVNAILTTVAPCVTFGQIAEIVDNGSTSCLTGASLYCCLFLVLCHWNIGVRYRTRVRSAYRLSETPLSDRLAHTLFPLCALCQEFRELNTRGFNPFLGYNGVLANIKHEHQQLLQLQLLNQVNPPTSQTMTRENP